MYDILQLNDMLVPELQDIAEQLTIPNFKKLDKQDLIYKILDSQSITTMTSETKGGEQEKPKRKRTAKANPANVVAEQAPVVEAPKEAEAKVEHKPIKKTVEWKG